MNSRTPSRVFRQGVLVTGIALLLVLLGANAISYLRAIDSVRQAQRAANLALTRGMAHALTGEIVARDFAGIESRLALIMLNESIESALVADASGVVFVVLRRGEGSAGPVADFSVRRMNLPPADQFDTFDETTGRQSIWIRVDAGMPVGWLHVVVGDSTSSRILGNLRRDTLVIASATTVIAGSLMLVLLVRIYRRFRRNEIRILEKARELQFDAFHDELTDLPNRKLLLDRLQQAVREADRNGTMVGIAFIDLDGFKQVNDTCGHEVGDRVLIETARRLGLVLRLTDTVSRFGGDEFVIVLPDITGWDACRALMERVLAAVKAPYDIEGVGSIQLSASIGVTLYPEDLAEPGKLIEHADAAMYDAKAAGKSQVSLYRELSFEAGHSRNVR